MPGGPAGRAAEGTPSCSVAAATPAGLQSNRDTAGTNIPERIDMACPDDNSPDSGDCGLALFETALGRCGIAWNAHGIVAAQLPEPRDVYLRARLLRRAPGAVERTPPPQVQRTIERIAALLGGAADDMADVALDMRGVPGFDASVYRVTRAIPPGATLSYGEVAAQLGDGSLARAVGQALGNNPFAPIVPCHRVLAAGGKPGGFSATGGVETKLRLLAIESVHTRRPGDLFDGF
jgi:methylated-DNA-[protein]-cysteine S-methyltransferase